MPRNLVFQKNKQMNTVSQVKYRVGDRVIVIDKDNIYHLCRGTVIKSVTVDREPFCIINMDSGEQYCVYNENLDIVKYVCTL